MQTLSREAPMPPWFEDLLHRYGWIWIGLAFGLAAKYALLLKRNVPLRWKLILADVLLLPMIALIAFWLIGLAGFRGEFAALFASICTVLGDRLVKAVTERFLQRVDSEVQAVAEKTIGVIRQQVTTERAGAAHIEAVIEGRAYESYRALEPHPQTSKKD